MSVRGFLLQATYRIDAGLPVVHLFGKLEDGRTFLVRDGRERPCFYVAARDGQVATEHGAETMAPANWTTMRGDPVVRVELQTPADGTRLRERLTRAGVATYEADLLFPVRYLIDRGLRGSFTIDGPVRSGDGVDQLFDDPALEPADLTPKLSVLSIDIETDMEARRLLSIGLVGCGAHEVLLLTRWGQSCPPTAIPYRTELELIHAFCRRVRELDPDIITGWNVIDFDLKVLGRMAANHGTTLELGRGPGAMRVRPARSVWGASSASIPGRVVLDGLHLVRGAFIRTDDYTLDAVAREVLGEGKTMHGEGHVEGIMESFEKDRSLFVEYNVTDARLVMGILEELELVELAVERSKLTGMPLDRVAASIAAFDFLYLSELHRRRIVAPTVVADDGSGRATAGGHVLEPVTGVFENVLLFDFKSLYPSIIRTFQIDPLGHVDGGDDGDHLVAPGGARFRREPGILPGLLDELVPRRERAKRDGDPVAANAIKILMNSFYGVLGAPACRFHSPAIANAITGFGRELLLWTKADFEKQGYQVLYGDTDSLFVATGMADATAARELGRDLVRTVNERLARHVAATWRVESRLELELETLYLRLCLPHVRHGAAGARKRYAGLVEVEGERRVVFTGMEAVRRDWTDLAKQVQRELFERLFSDRPVESYVRAVVADVRAGTLDHLLVYRKALRKQIDAYTAGTPPHVVAASKMHGTPGRLISYVVTRAGPEPAAERRSPIDHEHYVQKQVRPVAEPVLELCALDFDRVIGDDRQLSLF